MKIYLPLLLLACAAGALAFGYSHVTTAEPSLAVMTFNMGDIKKPAPGLEEVAETIRRSGIPSVLFLQEVPSADGAAFLAHQLDMSSHVFFPYRNRSSGMAILANAQLHNPQVLHFKTSERGRGAISAELTHRGMPIGLCSVHMDHISSVPAVSRKMLKVSLWKALTLIHQEIVSDTIRSRSTEELLAWPALHRYEKLIIGGDFNTVPLSKPIRLMNGRFNDVLWPSLEYFKGSYRKTNLPVAPRIDYIFVSREIPALEAAVSRDTPGDHYPIRARVVLEGKSPFQESRRAGAGGCSW